MSIPDSFSVGTTGTGGFGDTNFPGFRDYGHMVILAPNPAGTLQVL
jgi:hypothetical protein